MFFAVSSWEEWFSSLMCIPSGIFCRCKIDEILVIASFCIFKKLLLNLETGADFKLSQVVEKLSDLILGSLYDIAHLVFSSKVRNFLRKCLRSTASPLCNKGHKVLKIFLECCDSITLTGRNDRKKGNLFLIEQIITFWMISLIYKVTCYISSN